MFMNSEMNVDLKFKTKYRNLYTTRWMSIQEDCRSNFKIVSHITSVHFTNNWIQNET